MNPPIIVTGFGRCGTSMVMQMLAAGGVPCTGQAPAYEDASIALQKIPAEVLETLRGKAVKQLDVHRFGLASREPLVILMRRDPIQQAKSIAKFTKIMIGVNMDRSAVRELSANLIKDRKPMKVALVGARVLALSFEDVLRNPTRAACEISDFIAVDGFNTMAAAGVVKQRGAACLNNLNLELGLIGEMA